MDRRFVRGFADGRTADSESSAISRDDTLSLITIHSMGILESKRMGQFNRLVVTLERIAVAFWWGGFTFYASFVVRIGEDVSDATTQGFVTQQATHLFNLLAAILLFVSFYKIWLHRSRDAAQAPRDQRIKLVRRAAWTLVLLTLVGLLYVHQLLDAKLDPATFSIQDRPEFYRMHQAYLWLATFQWAGVSTLLLFPPEACTAVSEPSPSTINP